MPDQPRPDIEGLSVTLVASGDELLTVVVDQLDKLAASLRRLQQQHRAGCDCSEPACALSRAGVALATLSLQSYTWAAGLGEYVTDARARQARDPG